MSEKLYGMDGWDTLEHSLEDAVERHLDEVSEIETERVCNWRENQPGWAFCGCQVISRPIEMVATFRFCPFCGGMVEIKRNAKG